MKSLILFLQHVLEDLSTWSGIESTTRDLEYVARRTEHEGLSFLTISLSNFGKDFEKSLDQGYVGSDQFLGFPRAGGLPRLFSGFLRLVFDVQSGRLLDEPSSVAIWSIRQLSLMFAKINLPCSPERERAAYDAYIKCDSMIPASDEVLEGSPRMEAFQRVSMLLWANVLSEVNQKVYYHQIIPGHGPGATADKLKGNLKWTQMVWPRRLQAEFPVEEYLACSWNFFEEVHDSVSILEPGAEIPVKVITVPKTLKTPRIIAVEPTCMQYIQQGLLHAITEAVEADNLASQLIGWSSQVPNQEMARTGSLIGDLATLDLSEASDRVSNLHVMNLLARFTYLNDGIQACRSTKADVLGQIIDLNKFASMGSALTFPLEAMVFCTVIFLAVERKLNRRLTRADIKSYLGLVRVYGDDIIVPVDMVPLVVEELEAFGFKVNSSKSFWNGKFRESCGKEYYDGHDVSIVRLRSMFPTRRGHVSEIVSTASTRNQLYQAGMWKTAAYLDTMLERLIPFPRTGLNFVEDEIYQGQSQLVSAFSYLGYDESQAKYDHKLHRPLVKGVVASGEIPASVLGDHGALLKVLTKRGNMPFADVRHLERAGRPRSIVIKTRWSQPY